MRKRKRECGSYVDEETGEVTIVQTTKQAKRNHQKSGKWYKEPTAAELRIWEREAKQKELAQKALEREKNKKKNAVKRAEKEARELELKRQEFTAGKITFTQTLAKKDEDQLNLHSWFGGKPQKQGPAQSLSKAANATEQDKESELQPQTEVLSESKTAHGSPNLNSVHKLSQKSHKDDIPLSKTANPHNASNLYKVDIKNQIVKEFVEDLDIDMSQSFEDFDIAEDLDVGLNENGEIRPQSQTTDNNIEHEFRVPVSPTGSKRLPLSPMSQSDVNVRNSQTQQVSSFKSKLAESGISSLPSKTITNFPSTQMVRDLLTGLCTQDLDDDLDDDHPDKENESPWTSFNADEEVGSPLKRLSPDPKIPLNKSPSKSQKITHPITSLNDSFNGTDYDNIFAELGETITNDHANYDDFDDGLDDATLLSLPATQILLSTTKPTPQPITSHNETTKPHQTSTNELPIQPCDSFAIDGLSDHDLLQGLAQYEQSQNGPNLPIHVSMVVEVKKTKRTVRPWDIPGWIAETSGGQSQENDHEAEESVASSQRTESLSQVTRWR